MSLTKETNLTAATLTYTCACIAEGDLSTLIRMGLERDDIEILKQLTLGDIPRLGALESHFLTIQIDRDCLSRLLSHIQEQRQELLLRDLLIQADAPYAMIQTLYFDTSANEYSNLRKLYGLESVGRIPEPTESQEMKVLAAFRALKKSANRFRSQDWVALHETTQVPMRVLWLLIQRWREDADFLETVDSSFENDVAGQNSKSNEHRAN